MSKYQPLSARLGSHQGDEWRATFSDLEQVLGFPLPKGARSGRGWWANDAGKAHSRSWAGHGWQVGDIDPTAETVVFRRGDASAAAIQQAAQLEPLAEGVSVDPPDFTAGSQGRPQTAAGEIQPATTRVQETTAAPSKSNRGLGMGALVAGGVALVAGLGALALRRVMRRR